MFFYKYSTPIIWPLSLSEAMLQIFWTRKAYKGISFFTSTDRTTQRPNLPWCSREGTVSWYFWIKLPLLWGFWEAPSLPPVTHAVNTLWCCKPQNSSCLCRKILSRTRPCYSPTGTGQPWLADYWVTLKTMYYPWNKVDHVLSSKRYNKKEWALCQDETRYQACCGNC